MRKSIRLFGIPVILMPMLSVTFGAPSRGTLTLSIVDGFGNPVHRPVIQVLNAKDGIDYSPRFSSNRAADLPFGRYHITIGCTLCETRRLEIDLDQQRVDCLVGINMAPFGDPQPHSPEFEVRGMLIAARRHSETNAAAHVWIRLVPLFLERSFQILADESGEFSIKHVAPGAYILVAIDGAKVIYSEQISVTAKLKPIQISEK